MALKMAQPWKDPTSGVLHLRQRTPSDLIDQVRGAVILLPIGDVPLRVKIGDVVQASLRTKDSREAKSRHAIADAALRSYWDKTRVSGTQITHKTAVGLAGSYYRMMTASIDEKPNVSQFVIAEAAMRKRCRDEFAKTGLDPEKLDSLIAAIGDHLPPQVLALAPDANEKHPDAVDAVFGQIADACAFEERLILDASSRKMLTTELWRAWRLMMRRAEQLSEGDYRPDPNLDRFPSGSPTGSLGSSDRVTMTALIDRWSEKQRANLAPATVDRYLPSLRSFADFVGGKGISSITSDDVYNWAEKRCRDGVSARTVNNNDLVALGSILNWACRHQGGRILAANPARGIQIELPKSVGSREKTFRPEEIVRILSAANGATVRGNDKKLLAAKRWCPWLAAYTGARIFECTSIRSEDIRKEGEIWLVDLVRTKGNKPRRVPLHEHLTELGFIEFVQGSGPGPLFHNPALPEVKTHPADLRAEYLARWVREAAGIDDYGVSPNHGWRHTFKTRLLAEGVPERISDAITGHSSKGVARAYEAPTLEMMAAAVGRLARYSI